MYSILSGKDAENVQKFGLKNLPQEPKKAEEPGKRRETAFKADRLKEGEAEFSPDRAVKKEAEFVLGGFDFEYGGGYRRDEIMKKTLDEADAIIADAKKKAAGIKEEAYQEAFDKGLTDGREKGKSEYSVEAASLINAFKEGVQQLTDARNEFYSKSEKEMIDLIILIASEILSKEIREDKTIISGAIRKAVAELHSKQSVTIRLNKSDVDMANSMRETFLDEIENLEKLEFVVDNSITPGGCVVRTNIGMLDATVEWRLGEVLKNLKERLE